MIQFSHECLEKDYLLREEIIKNPKASLFAKLIDSTLLKQNATEKHIENLCLEAIHSHFRAVCIPPSYIEMAISKLQNTDVRLATVVGFPLGYNTLETKVSEVDHFVRLKVDEIDFVQNVTFVKNNNFKDLENEFQSIVEAAKGTLVKVILETALLTDDEIYKCASLAALSGIHVVKTSTGFASRGASLNDIEIIKKALNQYQNETGIFVGIKASGGIRNYQDALSLIQSGATRLGTSGGFEIVNEKVNHTSY
ncbi:deoxyribose-phosphate aldolase [Silvanigrella sp.]|uniref:deoxyribose-phosphate aldolase n=1 Tax=Silvanigrella sp. TaxID=2024976 RepID=UPI0037C55C51